MAKPVKLFFKVLIEFIWFSEAIIILVLDNSFLYLPYTSSVIINFSILKFDFFASNIPYEIEATNKL